MACILKLPDNLNKGVISFTNIEYFNQLKGRKGLTSDIELLKKKWIVCYHPNWEDKNFDPDDFFDAIIANAESFKFSSDKKNKIRTPIISTASNRMSPDYFNFGKEKIWDFFHVSRYESRKNIIGFFHVVKKAIEKKSTINGILLISVHPKDLKKVRKQYNDHFNEQQRRQFELITLDYDLPFPVSKKVIANFYSQSKVTLNTHLREPHGRVVGYALACGLPVVGFNDLNQMVPDMLQREPFFFTSDKMEELPELLIRAIDYVDKLYDDIAHREVSVLYSSTHQSNFLKDSLIELFNLSDSKWHLYDLDLRLSTHFLKKYTSNSHAASVLELVNILNTKSDEIGELSNEQRIEDAVSRLIKKNNLKIQFARKFEDSWRCLIKPGIRKKISQFKWWAHDIFFEPK